MFVPPPGRMREMSFAMRTRLRADCMRTHAFGLAVEADDLDVVVGAEELRRRERRALGEFERHALHRARAVDHQRERERRLIAATLAFHAHREQPFDLGALPSTERERTRSAGHHEAATEIANVTRQRLLRAERDVLRGHVREHDEVEPLQLAERLRELARAAHFDLEIAARECIVEVLRAPRIAFDVEHRGTPRAPSPW